MAVRIARYTELHNRSGSGFAYFTTTEDEMTFEAYADRDILTPGCPIMFASLHLEEVGFLKPGNQFCLHYDGHRDVCGCINEAGPGVLQLAFEDGSCCKIKKSPALRLWPGQHVLSPQEWVIV
jgi:hypothetical protein